MSATPTPASARAPRPNDTPHGGMYLSERQLAERYSVHRSTLRRWRRDREFPRPVRFSGNCTRWRLADVLDWEHSQERG